jgi:DoxX-like family
VAVTGKEGFNGNRNQSELSSTMERVKLEVGAEILLRISRTPFYKAFSSTILPYHIPQTRKQVPMGVAYLVITFLLAVMVTFSGIGKIRRDPRIVQVIHEVVGVPLKYFPLLAACEFAGAFGVVLGVWWPLLGVAAGIGLVIYFVGASVSHLRVGDVQGIGPAAFILVVAAAALALRVLTYKLHSAG